MNTILNVKLSKLWINKGLDGINLTQKRVGLSDS